MSRIDIEILTAKAASAIFAETWNRAAIGQDVEPRLAFGSYAELFRALPESRFELLRQVVKQPGLTVAQLAAGLAREAQTVEIDVAALLNLGLLEQDASGKLTAPYDEIHIHADLTKAA